MRGVYEYDDGHGAQRLPALREFYGAEQIPVLRRTKRGEGILDIAPHVRELTLAEETGDVTLEAVISVNEPTINPDLLAAALRQLAPELVPDFVKFTRLEIYDEKMEIFR